ncbi:MAG: 2-hydroxyacyl-CoA dehydratase [Eubacteriales bacterium]|nr:2-hydroxyacyl-CoA dehydratase [Eubacteriales bacterium]
MPFSDFTKAMKKEYTIIAPDIFPTHMELIREIFIMYGYKLEVVHYEGKKVIDMGLKSLHNDMCYPAICMLGQQLYALTCGDYDPHKSALIMFQTGGGCRASNYIWLLRKALADMGLEFVPVISVSFSGMEKYSGFRFSVSMAVKGIMAVVYGDMLMLLKNQITPYEVNKGETRVVTQRWIKELTEQFKSNRGLTPRSMRKNLSRMVKDFHEIPRIYEKKTKVGIVGEIYVKYSSFGNNNLEKFLATQDCEYMVPGVLGFFQYCFANMVTDYEYYGGSRRSKKLGEIGEAVGERLEKAILRVLKDYPEFVAPFPFEATKRMADKIIDRGVKMGEGWLLPAETAELIKNGYENIICAQPFGCLPNHIVGKGVIRTLRELYPQANICPIDYDSGASGVNQENRIKLMLAVAREEKSTDEENRP